MEKYYFITYGYVKNDAPATDYERSNCATNIHPMVWLKDLKQNYRHETYDILFFAEITKEEFDVIDGYVC